MIFASELIIQENKMAEETHRIENYIFEFKESAMSSVVAHHDTECIQRFFSEDFPYHTAVHKIENANFPTEYTEIHQHKEAEINLLISADKNFAFKVVIGNETKVVKGNTGIYIPANIPHSANVLEGSGYYIAIRI